MGTRLERVAACRGGSEDNTALALAIRAAKQVVRDEQGQSARVSLLVYTGVYRDGDVQEPAQAPFVQRAIGESAGKGPENSEGTFCFDIDRLVAAIEVADGLVQSHSMSAALVVAADRSVDFVEPKGHRVPEAAAALLLTPNHDSGFVGFHHAFFPEYGELHQASLCWVNDASGGRHQTVAKESPRYLDACVDAAAQSLLEFLAEFDVPLDDDLLLLPSQYPVDFPERLRTRLGLKPAQVVDVTHAGGAGPLTAGPLVALAAAIQDGRCAAAPHLVFVTVDPGLTVSLALYANRR